MYIDTHTHLYSSQFDEDRIAVIQRAIELGVDKLLLPNIDRESVAGMIELQKQFPLNCYPMLGLHPCSVGEYWEEDVQFLKEQLSTTKCIAIGEIGIDLYWDKTYQKEQEYAFIEQVNWAKSLNLPIVIHARDSFPEIFRLLDELNDERLRGVFHCFTGNEEDVVKIRSYGGFLFGIGGVLTFKKSGSDQVVKHISLDEIVLETDSPYLAPTPHRGKRNESSFIPIIANKLSDIFEISEKEIARITSENAVKLFGL
jgi:TatD DNase family protein